MVIDLNDLEAITRPPPVFLPLPEERREIVVVFAHSESSITRLVTQRCTRTSSSVNLSSSCRVCRQTKLSMFPIESPSDRRQRPHVRVYHRSDNFRFDDRTRDIVLVRFTLYTSTVAPFARSKFWVSRFRNFIRTIRVYLAQRPKKRKISYIEQTSYLLIYYYIPERALLNPRNTRFRRVSLTCQTVCCQK